MYTMLIILFIIICGAMVVGILLQSSKGGLASTFGGGMGAGGVMSSRGAASFLHKLTIGLAVTYGLLCLLIGWVGRSGSDAPSSIIQDRLNQEQGALPGATGPIEIQDQPTIQVEPTPSDSGSGN